jgi:gamma-D-glutamyl-L-lysine dipeptidyl-peptidase
MAGVNIRRYVSVPVTTLWTSPQAPRKVDARAVAPRPDVVAWLADLDAAEARLGLHGRALTQLELGEPVQVTGGAGGSTTGSTEAPTAGSAAEGWLQVVAPLQPTSRDSRGYPGWVFAGHVSSQAPDRSPLLRADDSLDDGDDGGRAKAFVAGARARLGLPYLWGGMCDWALDCSGLVHLGLRRLGVVVPRDADDQYDACEHIPADEAHPGDLFFFAHEGRRPHHVGIVTGPGRMLHAPETGALIIEEPLTPARRDSLIGAGRLSSLWSRPSPTELKP